MAAPSYTTDLAIIDDCDAVDANWTEPTGFTIGAITLPETDYFIEETGCLSKNINAAGSAGAIYNTGAGQTIAISGAVLTWIYFGAPNALQTQAAGGYQLFAGSATSAFKQFYVRGSDTWQYGGWLCIPVCPSIETGAITVSVVAASRTYTRTAGGSGSFITDGFEAGQTVVVTGFTNGGNNGQKIIESVTATVITITSGTGLINESGTADEQIRFADALTGSPSTTRQYFGGGAVVPGPSVPSKGNPFGIDSPRFGRCDARISGGETSNYATFAGYAAVNDATTARYGLIQAVDGGYLWQGLLTLGYGGPVDFRDSNTLILIADTQKVYSDFNKIEIKGPTSRVDWTSISFLALGTASKGRLEVVENADVNILGCTFTDMDTFKFLGSSSVQDSTFRRCGQITAPGTVMTGTSVDSYTGAADTSAVVWNVDINPDGYLDDMIFTKGSLAHHAIEMGTTSPTTMTLRGLTFAGFNSSNGQNDSVLHIKRDSGAVTINAINCTGTVSYKSAGAAVTVEVDPVDLFVHVQDIDTSADISGATVLVTVTSGVGGYPYNEGVTITRSVSTATVTHTAHGLITNDYVVIAGASGPEYNGVFQITRINDDSYSYTVSGTPDTPDSGTSTFAVISGTTDVDGNISNSKSYSADQPITGKVRKATGGALYVTAPISGEIDSISGLSLTVQLVPDE